MRGKKIRDIDYSYSELCEEIGIKPQNLKNSNKFKRFLELYEFEIEDFKKSNESKDDYIFAIEWYQLLVTILKNIEKNPFYRANYKEENINAEEIKEYLDSYINEIENYDDYVKNLVQYLPIYLDTLKIVEYIPVIAEKLSQFIVAIIKANNGEIGTTLKYISEQLDYNIYHLFRNNYYMDMLSESSCSDDLMKVNIPIDTILSNLLKISMDKTSYINKSLHGIDEFDEIPEELLLMMGIEKAYRNDSNNEETDNNENLFIKRLLYKGMLREYYISENVAITKKMQIEEYKNRKIKTIKDKIINNEPLSYEINRTLEEQLQYLEHKRDDINDEIERIKNMIKNNECDTKNINEDLMKKEYLKYIDELKIECKPLMTASNHYIGQAIIPYIKIGKTLSK